MSSMIITISGMPGAGKTTAAKILAEKLKLRHYSTGELMRRMAREKGLSLIEFIKVAEKNQDFDRGIDAMSAKLGKTEDNFVIDTRIGFYFIPKSVKVFLKVSIEEGARRIFNAKGEEARKEERYRTIEELKKELQQRVASENKRFRELYGIDVNDESQFDIIVDTTKLDRDDVAGRIVEFVKRFKKK